MTERTFSVGQVVFVFSREKSKLVPARIVEEVVKRTIDGVRTSYSLQYSAAEPHNGTIDLDAIKDEVFTSADEAQSVLLERTAASVKKLVAAAVQRAGTLFPDNLDEITRPDARGSSIAVDVDEELVELPDGSKARLRIKQ